MQLITNILNATAISQDVLAEYIGLTRQALMKAARNVISLDSAVLIKLSRLQQCIDNAAAAEKQIAISTAIPGHAAERETICRYNAFLLKRKLDGYEQFQKKFTQFLRALESLEPQDDKETNWIQRTKKTL
ncbi:MAG: hypothetical protein QM737_07995 [Ferruginibacter sp.]